MMTRNFSVPVGLQSARLFRASANQCAYPPLFVKKKRGDKGREVGIQGEREIGRGSENHYHNLHSKQVVQKHTNHANSTAYML